MPNGGTRYLGELKGDKATMAWIIIATIVYLLVGGTIFYLVTLTDEYCPQKWIPIFLITVFLWPLMFLGCAISALAK